MMSSSTEQWFVRTSFGALLGPMPEDALDEMARTGALLRTDKIRAGADGVWHPAGDVPGLFDGVAAPSSQPGARVGDLLPRAMPDGSFVMAKASEIPRSRDDTAARDLDQPTTSPAEPTSLEGGDPLQEVFWRMSEPIPPEINSAEADRPQKPDDSESVVRDEVDFEVAGPLISTSAATPSTPPEPPVIEELDFGCSDFVADTASASIPATDASARAESRSFDKPSRSDPGDSLRRITPGLPQRSAASLRWSATRIFLSRHRTALVTAAGLFILLAAWWFWPRQRPDIFARYVAIHDELQKRRDTPTDRAGLEEFVSRANKELDKLIPALDKSASPNPEQRLLLFIGRDCLREMLKQPKEENVRHERLFAAFSGQLQEIYTPSDRTEPDAVSSGRSKSEPNSPTGLRTPHPDSARGRSGGFANPSGSGTAVRPAVPPNASSGPMPSASPKTNPPVAANPSQPRSSGSTKLPGISGQ